MPKKLLVTVCVYICQGIHWFHKQQVTKRWNSKLNCLGDYKVLAQNGPPENNHLFEAFLRFLYFIKYDSNLFIRTLFDLNKVYLNYNQGKWESGDEHTICFFTKIKVINWMVECWLDKLWIRESRKKIT